MNNLKVENKIIQRNRSEKKKKKKGDIKEGKRGEQERLRNEKGGKVGRERKNRGEHISDKNTNPFLLVHLVKKKKKKP